MTINSFCLYVPPKLAEPANLVELMSSEDFKKCIGGTTPGIFKREGGVPGYIGLIQDSSGIYLRIGRTTITDTDLRTILKNGDFSKNSGNKESFLAPYGQYCAINIDFGQHICIRVLTDPMGIRSVFVRQCAAGGWIICSQISDFKDIDENLEMDSQARDFLLRYAYLREGVSLYQQVVELYPAKVYQLTHENIECD